MQLIDNPSGNYRFLTGIAPYSAGVTALPGHEIVRAVLAHPLPWREGFARMERHLNELGRPRAALCAVELRSPAPFTFAGFAAFNGEYQTHLAQWGLLLDGRNPVARTNVAPAVNPPAEPSLYAFSYTVPTASAGEPRTFIVAGAGDLRDQADLSPTAIVRPGDTSAAAMREKAAAVLNVMQERLSGLGMAWADVGGVGVYTVQPLHSLLEVELLPSLHEATKCGIHWHYSRPPIAGLEFEMDLRGVRVEERVGTGE
ncbi:MAG: RidA family protein [Chloroflexi bacterium]|nr:RidA family protein [Chloroflexota bacterium]